MVLAVAVRWLVVVTLLLCSRTLTAEKGGAVVVMPHSSMFDIRLPLAGGIAGGVSNGILYPLDTIKTMQQSDPSIRGMKAAVVKVYRSADSLRTLYSGFWAAVVGSVPSSALYFGTYETAKKVLYSRVGGGAPNGLQRLSRPFIHMLAAASGNVMSSFVFVPKDAIKQQLQVREMPRLEIPSSPPIQAALTCPLPLGLSLHQVRELARWQMIRDLSYRNSPPSPPHPSPLTPHPSPLTPQYKMMSPSSYALL